MVGWESPAPNPIRKDPVISNTEIMLRAAFTEAGYKTHKGLFISQFPKAIDFASETVDGDLWLECDGPPHFLNNPMGTFFRYVYGGKTLFRAGLIQEVNAVGRILHTPFSVTDLVLSKETSLDARRSMLDFLASATKYMSPGSTALADLRYDGGHIDMLMMPLEPGKGIGAPFAQMRVR